MPRDQEKRDALAKTITDRFAPDKAAAIFDWGEACVVMAMRLNLTDFEFMAALRYLNGVAGESMTEAYPVGAESSMVH